MRNPDRIAGFLNQLLPYENQILTSKVIYKIIHNVIKNKLYKTMYEMRVPKYKQIFESEDLSFNDEQVEEQQKQDDGVGSHHGYNPIHEPSGNADDKRHKDTAEAGNQRLGISVVIPSVFLGEIPTQNHNAKKAEMYNRFGAAAHPTQPRHPRHEDNGHNGGGKLNHPRRGAGLFFHSGHPLNQSGIGNEPNSD